MRGLSPCVVATPKHWCSNRSISRSFNKTCAPVRRSTASQGAPKSCFGVERACVPPRWRADWSAAVTRSGASKNGTATRGLARSWIVRGQATPRLFPPLQIAQTVALACRKPEDLGLPLVRWSMRTLTAHLIEEGVFTQIHYSSVCLMLQAVDLQPHRTLYWKRSHDPEFTAKTVHVLWYYERIEQLEANAEPIFAFDEKPGIQLLDRTEPDEAARPGSPLRRSFEYIRLGTGLLMMLVHLATGRLKTWAPRKKSGPGFTALLDEHLETLPKAKKVHYILDNDPTHTSAHTRAWLASQRGRVRFHYTPKYASWLNQAEIGLNCYSTRYLRGKVWKARNEFAPHIRRSTRDYNEAFAHPFNWTFTRKRFHEWRFRSKTCSTGH